MELTKEQKENRENLLGWFDETRSNIIEHIERDINDYKEYLLIKESKTPNDFCISLIKILGNNHMYYITY